MSKRDNTLYKGRVWHYIRLKLPRASEFRTSVYTLACRALAQDGFPKPDGVSDKAWVKKHIAWTKAYVEKNKSLPQKHKVQDVSADAFLSSYDWRKLRMQAILRYGRKCMCCGATPETGAVIHVDHIKPRKLFPDLALELSNLQVLCHECNHGKGNWDQTDWRPFVVDGEEMTESFEEMQAFAERLMRE